MTTARHFLLLLLLFCSSHSLVRAAQSNVLLIMADDFGYECVTANGGESYQTPHLDRLAAGGMRFENCHSQPLCTPTRVQLMTGKYNVRDLHQKLYRTGRFFDLRADPDEQSALTTLSADQAAAKAKLQAVLDKYKDARPAALDRQLQESTKNRPEGRKDKKPAK